MQKIKGAFARIYLGFEEEKILRHAFGKRHCADSKEGGD